MPDPSTASGSVVDNLLIGLLGTYTMDYALPVPLVVVLLVPLAAALFWWWRQAPDGRLLLLGAGLIGSSYLLTYSARAEWGYVGVMTGPMMGRYHLLPQLGLALVVCGGLPGRNGRWFCLDEAGVLSRRQVRALALLIGLCFVVQLPRGVLCRFPPDPQQARAFRRIDAMRYAANTTSAGTQRARCCRHCRFPAGATGRTAGASCAAATTRTLTNNSKCGGSCKGESRSTSGPISPASERTTLWGKPRQVETVAPSPYNM